MKRFIKYIFGLSWLGIVAFYFYKNHTYYQFDFSGILQWWPLWVFPFVAYGFFLIWHWIKEEKTFKFKLTVPRILAGFFLGMLFIGSVTMLTSHPMMYKGIDAAIMLDGTAILGPSQQQIDNSAYFFNDGTSIKDTYDIYESVPPEIQANLIGAGFFDIIIGLSWTFLKVYGTALILIFFAWIIGSAFHAALRRKKKHKEENPFEQGVIDSVLGLGLVTTLFFIMAAFGLFNLIALIGAMVLVLGILYKHTLKQTKKLWNWKEGYEIKITNIAIPLFIILSVLVGIQLFDNLSPLPRGWDGLNRYIVIAKDLAEGGNLLQRGSVYAWELILGFFYLIDIKMTLAWTSLPGMMTFVLIWLLARRFSSNVGTVLAIMTILLMPMMSFHISDENKVDVAHWLMGTASLISFLKAISFEKGVKIKDYSYLWIAGLLAGFAFTVKFTAAILIVTLLSGFAFVEGGVIGIAAAVLVAVGILATAGGIGIGSEFMTSGSVNSVITMVGIISGLALTSLGFFMKKIKINSVKTLAIFLLFIMIPIAPWIVKNAIETDSITVSNLVSGGNAIPEVNFDLDGSLCTATAFFEEYDRYIGYNDNILFRIVELPWHLTMNDTGAAGAYVDMGFAFLGFLLLGILFYKPSRKKNFVLILGILYFVFWLIKANGVSWYGFPMFSLLAVYLATTYTSMSKDWIGRIALLLVLGLWFSTAFDARLNNYAKPGLMLSHSGNVTYDDVRESVFPNSDELMAILTENEGLVYKIGTPLGYFIPNYVERTFDDQLLDRFNCVYKNNPDYSNVRNKLREVGFRFVLYDSYTYTVGLDPEGTLADKIAIFEDFAREELFLIIYDDTRGHHLFYLPTDQELYQTPDNTDFTEVSENSE